MTKRVGDLSIGQDGLVSVITIHRPPNNYISRRLIEDLGQVLADLDDQPQTRAVLLLAEGKNFCAGAQHDPDDPETLAPDTHDEEGRYAAVARLFSSQKPIVAAIQGAVVGAGFGMCMLADFRIAAPNARFSANFVKIGFCPGFGLTYTLPRAIGLQRATFMFQTGRRFTAEEVAPWGLVDGVAPLEALTETAMALAKELAGNAPLGMAATRRRLREEVAAGVLASIRIDSPEQTRLRLTEDHLEGVIAYRDRRPAVFSGR
jgi:enoyl-CoA hydratase/carnithine racemase